MRCLIIDNYDSFTWNLADYVAQVFGSAPLVIRNDQYTWSQITDLHSFGCIIVSPGPGSVTNPEDFNASKDALEQDDVPVLGVCLGLQGLAHVYGGQIAHAPVPFHGRKSVIQHDGSDLFKGVPQNFDGVRYHSLVVRPESLPANLIVTARTDCGLIMGLQHATRPKWGVQFHPESILTAYGKQIISNFREQAYKHVGKEPPGRAVRLESEGDVGVDGTHRRGDAGDKPEDRRRLRLFARKLASSIDPQTAFLQLYAGRENCFWLDSQSAPDASSRFSFMGSGSNESLLVCRLSGDASTCPADEHLTMLDRNLESVIVDSDCDVPFEFRGGYVGFMTYEMKAAFGSQTSHRNRIPDSAWMRADRFLAFDHASESVWLVAIADRDEKDAVDRWMDETEATANALRQAEGGAKTLGLDRVSVSMDFGREEYLAAIESCKEKIVDGESYEVCLTNRFSLDLKLDPVALYLVMRKANPAPFGAFIKVGINYIMSTSPERFLKVDASGAVQTKPIKGTIARSDDPHIDRRNAARLATSEKDRAENLMIVDLMRNDLGRVSVPGSVRVSKLMDIESFKTVHQMVSTVEARLMPGCSLVDLLRASFPGGSITGAPKIRTMEIIDRLEQTSRGVYCGTIGYLGYNTVADLNVAIRTASYDGNTVKFGAGGAITYLSDPKSEFAEIMLKAEAVLRPIWEYVKELGSPLSYSLRHKTMNVEVEAIHIPGAAAAVTLPPARTIPAAFPVEPMD
ncbi:aminodeoxychorismate synthase component I [Sorangium sp. So ce131]|uniref:aminodeoxychorismate synthase component I n=1 Tax=Sorangium sp. So ce131 TaxID=3133282 RepID=UPI003F5FB53F